MECREPKDAPLIVNEVVNQWLHTVRQRTAAEFADEALVAAQQEMDALQSEITEARERLAAIGERLPPGPGRRYRSPHARCSPSCASMVSSISRTASLSTSLQLAPLNLRP